MGEMDNILHIKVETDVEKIKAMKAEFKDLKDRLDLLDYQFRQGNITRQTFDKGVRDITDHVKEMNVSSVDAIDINKRIYQVTERANQGFKSMGQSLREIQREGRMMNRIMREVSSSVSEISVAIGGNTGLGKGVMDATMAFRSMHFALGGIEEALVRQGGQLGEIGEVLGGISTKITILGAAFIFLGTKSTELNERLAKSREELRQLRDDAGNFSKYEYKVRLTQQLAEVREEAEKLHSKIVFWYNLGIRLIPALFGVGEADEEELLVKAEKIQNALNKLGPGGEQNISTLDLLNLKYAVGEATTAELKAEVEKQMTIAISLGQEQERLKLKKQWMDLDKQEQAEKSAARLAWEDKMYSQMTRLSPEDVQQTVKSAVAPGALKGVKERPLSDREMNQKDSKLEWKELTENQKMFFDSTVAGVQGVSATITSWVGGAWERTFGVANSLLGAFAQNFVVKLSENLVGRGVKSLFSLIPGLGWMAELMPFAQGGIISEPVFGVGASGRGYMFGEAGPERVSPVGRMTTGGYSGNSDVVSQFGAMLSTVRFEIQGTKLIGTFNRAQASYNRYGYK